MEQTTTIFCSSSKETFPIHGRFNCKTKKVIYVITCTKCGLQYVSQSSYTFNERFRNHLSDIRQENADKPVSRHFSTNSHNVKDVSAIIVTSTNGNINIRHKTEEAWIARLQSRMPNDSISSSKQQQDTSLINNNNNEHLQHMPKHFSTPATLKRHMDGLHAQQKTKFQCWSCEKIMPKKKTFYNTQERRMEILTENLLLLHSPTNTTSQKYLSQRRGCHLWKADLDTL